MRPTTIILLAALSLTAAPASWATGAAADHGALQDHLRRALHASGEVRYRSAAADLDGDGVEEMAVYVTSPEFCGSGGCNLLVLQRRGRGYRTVMNATIARPPIRALETRSHGWRDIGVRVGGGGIVRSFEAVMRFDGERYPSNPSMAPVARRHAPGRVLIGAQSR